MMNEANGLNEVMFTSAAVLDLLLQIDELKDYSIGMTETLDGNLQLQIGSSIYVINNDMSKTIHVEDEVVGEIEMTTEEAYDEISEDVGPDFEMSCYDGDLPVEASIIKEITKSLTLGGLIRFATKHLLK